MSRERQKQSSLEMQHCEVPVGKVQRYFGVPWIRPAGRQANSQPASQAAYYRPQTRWSLHLPIYTSVNCQPPPALQSSPVVEPERTTVFPLHRKKTRSLQKWKTGWARLHPCHVLKNSIKQLSWVVERFGRLVIFKICYEWRVFLFTRCMEGGDGWMNVCIMDLVGASLLFRGFGVWTHIINNSNAELSGTKSPALSRVCK